MSDAERRMVCADDDLDLDRTTASVAPQVGDVLFSVTTGKRLRSRSRSSSAQAPAKMLGRSATERRYRALADEEASKEDIHRGEHSFEVVREPSDAQEKGGPSTGKLPVKSTAGADGCSPRAKESNQSDHMESFQLVLEQNLDQLRPLSREARDLALRQQQGILAAERLQERLTKSERTYGELLRESLELQRSLEERRQQIKIDKQELEKEHATARATSDRLCTILATIDRLSHVIPSTQRTEAKST